MEHHSLKMSLPSDLVCPLTQELFVNPVNCCVNGHIFDLGAINEWFHGDRDMGRPGNDSCPTCRAKLGSFRPERDLQRRVKEWKAANPGVVAATVASTGTQPFKDCKVKLSATDMIYQGRHRFVNVVAEADPSAARQPGVYILGLDFSGSMAELVDKTATEVFYTRMDLAKYTIRCVSRMLGPQDSLALVTFSTGARVAMEPTLMDDAGRRRLDHLLEHVEPDASTNIDAAITTMMSVANSPELAGCAIFAALLTDGAETVVPHPTVGTVRWLTRQEMKNPWTLSTFGFGYELDSQLLKRIAEMPTSGSGVFGFIPDLSMIATVFINWAANCMSTGSRNAVINVNVNGTTATFNTGTLSIGQPRNFLVEVPLQGADVKVSLDDQEVVPTPSDETYPLVWNAFTTAMEQVVTGMGLGRGVMTIYDDLYYAHKGNMDPRVQALMRDVRSADSSEGQVGMAPQFWERWGAHYTRSYVRAQQVQRRLNFKDPGSLIYGDATFEALASEGEKLFLSMEPPTPTGRGSGAVQTTSAQLSTYLRSATQGAYSGGCFSGDTQVLVGDGTQNERLPIKSLLPGDLVWTPSGMTQIKAVVTMGHKSVQSLMMCHVKGALITPYHPYINDEGVWTTGADTVPVFEWDEPGLKLYNLVLESGHIVDVGGVLACTLAHGFKGPVIEHPFFGTQSVIECLKMAKGWNRRMPYYNDLQVRRRDGLIVDWYEGSA
jgi:hypothetical protein